MKSIFALFLLTSTTFIFSQPDTFTSRGIGGGGALFAPVVNPHNPDQIFVACDMTQQFVSYDKGTTWNILPFSDLVITAQSEIQFTNDPNILYNVGLDFRNDITYPAKSIDGGQTWNFINTPQADGIIYLDADYENPQRIIVTDWGKIYISKDAGQTWDFIFNNSSGAYLAGVVWNDTEIFIGTNYGVLYSDDNGSTFNDLQSPGLPSGKGFTKFDGIVHENGIRLIGVMADREDIYPWVQAADYGGYAGVYKLDFGADNSWIDVSPNNIPNSHKFFQFAQTSDPNIAYLSGTDASNSFPIIYKTADGGQNWNSVLTTMNNQNIETGWCGFNGDENWWYAESPLGFTDSPLDPNHIIISDFGTLHSSLDGGLTWKANYIKSPLNPAGIDTPVHGYYESNGFENTSCWWMHWENQNDIYVGFSDVGGIHSNDGGTKWTFDKMNRDFNSTYHILKHPTSDIIYSAHSSIHDMYQSTRLKDNILDIGDGSIMFSTDKGDNWDLLHDFNHSVMWMSIDPDNSENMYASVVHSDEGGIYKTSNLSAGSSSTWTKLSEPQFTEGHPFSIHSLGNGDLVCSYSGRRENSGAFTGSSGVFFSDDDGTTWTNVGTTDMDYWTKDLVIDPHDSDKNTWYACVFSGWGGAGNNSGGLYRTLDRGANWQRIADNFRVESATVHPDYPDIMYMTTEDEGLWLTQNLSDPNPIFTQVTSYDFQHPVRVFYNPTNTDEIWVSSFGNGLKVGQHSIVNSVEESDLLFAGSLYPTITDDIAHLSLNVRGNINMKLIDSNGTLIQDTSHNLPDEQTVIQLDLSTNPTGVYFVKIYSKNGTQLFKVIKI